MKVNLLKEEGYLSMKPLFSGLKVSHKTDDGNLFVFSSLHEFSREWKNGLPYVTIRYVISGREQYNLNGESLHLTKGNFLLVNKGEAHSADMPYSNEVAAGFCVLLNGALLADVCHYNTLDNRALLDNPFDIRERAFDFFEGIYGADDVVSTYLAGIESKVDKTTGDILLPPEELFFNLAERLLMSQAIIRKRVDRISACKYSTRQELYKRIDRAKRMLDGEHGDKTSIACVAEAVALSQFHFYRAFKQIHGITPHQYRLKRKLHLAGDSLLRTTLAVTQVAHEFGFADVQSFSKAFTKEFSVSPIAFRKSTQR